MSQSPVTAAHSSAAADVGTSIVPIRRALVSVYDKTGLDRLAAALIKAGKHFDYLFMPNVGHSSGGRYGQQRREDFFVRHLHGNEPPDRNATSAH